MEDIATWIGIGLISLITAGMLWNDRVRIARRSLRVEGEVVGHRSGFSDGDVDYAAIYRFSADGVEHEVVDGIYTAVKRPDIGTRRELRYSEGRPDLARPPRIAYWAMVYAMLAGMAGILVAKLLGWIA